MRITADELRARLNDHIAAVEAGEHLTIVNAAGDPIAKLEAAEEPEPVVVPHDPAKRLSDFVPGKRPRLDFDAVEWLIHDRERSRY